MTIKTDDVFIYPTDTVWGIGCSIYSESGFIKISEIKKASKNKPLSIMFASVEDVYKSFDFPEEVTLEWLREFFKLETTLGFPLKASKIKIPKWATADSDYVSIRCLETEVIKNIYRQLGTPFFSTSLNLSGESPITKNFEAKAFHQKHAHDALFLESADDKNLSGSSSTMVFLNENLDFEIKREGKRASEVKDQLMKLFQG